MLTPGRVALRECGRSGERGSRGQHSEGIRTGSGSSRLRAWEARCPPPHESLIRDTECQRDRVMEMLPGHYGGPLASSAGDAGGWMNEAHIATHEKAPRRTWDCPAVAMGQGIASQATWGECRPSLCPDRIGAKCMSGGGDLYSPLSQGAERTPGRTRRSRGTAYSIHKLRELKLGLRIVPAPPGRGDGR